MYIMSLCTVALIHDVTSEINIKSIFKSKIRPSFPTQIYL